MNISSDLSGIPVFFLCSVMLGPFALEHILSIIQGPYTNDELRSVSIKHYVTKVQHNKIVELASNDTYKLSEIIVGGEKIDRDIVLPYANALSFYLKGNSMSGITSGMQEVNNAADFNYWKRTKKLFLVASSGLIGLLLFSISASWYYSAEKKELEGKYQRQFQKMSTVDSLRRELATKKEVLSMLNLWQASYSSFYLDRLAANIDPGIVLTNLKVFPLKESLAENEYEFNENQIIVQGECPTSEHLASCILKLGDLPWVDQVKEQRYKWDHSKKSGRFQFTMVINNRKYDPKL